MNLLSSNNNQGLSLDQASMISDLMANQDNSCLSEQMRDNDFLFLIQIKSEMLAEELYEQMRDFKILEDLNDIHIPVEQMSLL